MYELFLTIHIILIILALVACWYHLVPHFGFKVCTSTFPALCHVACSSYQILFSYFMVRGKKQEIQLGGGANLL